MMKSIYNALIPLCFIVIAEAKGPRPGDLGATKQPIGDEGVIWYTTWKTALEEANRSGRPIMYYAVAAQCGSVSGTF